MKDGVDIVNGGQLDAERAVGHDVTDTVRTMPRQSEVAGSTRMGRVGSVTETDQDTITNGVLRVTYR